MCAATGANISPPVKRAADLGEKVTTVRNLVCRFHSALARYRAEQAVIRRQEGLPVGAKANDATPGAYARIHNADKNGSRWKVSVGSRQHERRFRHVLRGDFMRQVNHPRIRATPADDAFHDAHVTILQPEIRQQHDGRE